MMTRKIRNDWEEKINAVFPDELLIIIFTSIDNLKTLKESRLVCRHWCELASLDELWEPFFHKRWIEHSYMIGRLHIQHDPPKNALYLKEAKDKYLFKWARHTGKIRCNRNRVAIHGRIKTLKAKHWKDPKMIHRREHQLKNLKNKAEKESKCLREINNKYR